MTDRLNALIVVLEEDTRTDDAETLIAAIRQLRGVASVTGNVVKLEDHVAVELAKYDLRRKIYNVLK